jgi:hypothetical protein
MEDIDYVKLAKANTLVKKWREKTISLINDKNRKMFSDAFGIRKINTTVYFVRFFKKHYKEAVNLLGKQFARDYKKMFYAETVENELIKKFIPAVYSWLGKMKISGEDFEDVFSEMLLAVRNSVWMYTRSDIMFTTYAINGIKAGIPFAISRINEKKSLNRTVSFEELTKNSDESADFAGSIEDHRQQKDSDYEVKEFLEKICSEANLTVKQREVIEKFLKTGETDKFLFYDTRKRLRKFYEEREDLREAVEKLLNR